MKTLRDVSIVRNSIARNEGVVACQLNREKGEVEIVYDNYLLDINIVIEDLEELGFNVV
jgi:hypothetical protein